MRACTAIFALASAAGALAQLPAPIQQVVGQLSSSCQQTILSLAVTSELSQCLRVNQLLPIVVGALQSNGSLLPVLDQVLSVGCGQSGCSNATLTAAYQQFGSRCATDLEQYNVSNETLRTIFAQYSLAREAVCLRTVIPYNGTDAPLPLTAPAFNLTDGAAYCASSVLTEVSAVIGENLTIPWIRDLAGAYNNNTLNSTLAAYGFQFNSSLFCNDCIFGWADLVGVAYPGVGNVSLSSVGINDAREGGQNVSNVTIAQALDSCCAAEGFTWTDNGTLPGTVRLSAFNSTFSYNIITGAIQTTGRPSTSPVRRNVADIKVRWIGQY